MCYCSEVNMKMLHEPLEKPLKVWLICSQSAGK
jgi:hypothetical protein